MTSKSWLLHGTRSQSKQFASISTNFDIDRKQRLIEKKEQGCTITSNQLQSPSSIVWRVSLAVLIEQWLLRSTTERERESEGNVGIRDNQSLLKTFAVFLFLKQMMTNVFVDTTNTRMAFRPIPLCWGDERKKNGREAKRERKSYIFFLSPTIEAEPSV